MSGPGVGYPAQVADVAGRARARSPSSSPTCAGASASPGVPLADGDLRRPTWPPTPTRLPPQVAWPPRPDGAATTPRSSPRCGGRPTPTGWRAPRWPLGSWRAPPPTSGAGPPASAWPAAGRRRSSRPRCPRPSRPTAVPRRPCPSTTLVTFVDRLFAGHLDPCRRVAARPPRRRAPAALGQRRRRVASALGAVPRPPGPTGGPPRHVPRRRAARPGAPRPLALPEPARSTRRQLAAATRRRPAPPSPDLGGRTGGTFRRTTCCLWWKTTAAAGKPCADCSLPAARSRLLMICAPTTTSTCSPCGRRWRPCPRGSRRSGPSAASASARRARPRPRRGDRAVLVRLLKGRAGVGAALRRAAAASASRPAPPSSPSEARPTVDAELTALSTVPAGIVTEAFGYLVAGRTGQPGAPPAVRGRHRPARGVRVRSARRHPPMSRPRSAPRRGPRPADRRRRHLPGQRAGRQHPARRAAVRRDRAAGGQRPWRATPTPCATTPTPSTCSAGRRRGRHHHVGRRRQRPRRATQRPTTGRRPSTSSTCPSSRRWRPPATRRPGTESSGGLSPLDVALGVAIPEFDGRIIGPPLSFKEVVDDGDELGVALAAHRAVPDRVERIAGLAIRLARLRRRQRRQAGRRRPLRLSHQAQPHRQRRRPRHPRQPAPACSTPWPPPATRSAEVPDDSDALHGPAGRRPHLRPPVALARPAGARPSDASPSATTSSGSPPCPAPCGQQIETSLGTGARATCACTTATSSSPASTSATWWSPSSRPGASARTPSAPTTPPTCRPPPLPGLLPVARRRGWGADAVVHMGKHGTLEWLPGKGVGPVGGVHPRRRPRRPAAALPVRRQRPRRGHAGQAPQPTPSSSTTSPPPMTRAETYDDAGPGGAAARRATPRSRRSTRPSCPPSGASCGTCWSTSELARDLGVDEMPDPDDFAGHDQPRRRLPVRPQGRPDPRRAARARARRPAARPWSTSVLAITRQPQGDRCRRCGRRWPPSSASTWPHAGAGRRGRPAWRRSAAAGRGAGRRRVGPAAATRRPRAGVDRVDRWSRPWPRTPDEIDNLLAGARRPLRAGRAERRADPRDGARAADRAQLLLDRPRRVPSPCRLGRRAGRWPTRLVERHLAETGASPAHGRPDRVGHDRHAHPRRRHRRGPGAARRAPGLAPPALGAGRRPRGHPAGGAGPAAGRRACAHLGLLPRRLPPPGRPPRRRRAAWSPALDEPAATVNPRARRGHRPTPAASAATAARGALRSRASCRRIERGHRGAADADLAEVYLAWGGYAYSAAAATACAAPDADAPALRRPSRWRSRTRTTASTTSSTATTTCSSTAG